MQPVIRPALVALYIMLAGVDSILVWIQIYLTVYAYTLLSCCDLYCIILLYIEFHVYIFVEELSHMYNIKCIVHHH